MIDEEGLLKGSTLILGGNLNLVTSSHEFWVVNNRLDVLTPYFISLVDRYGLVNVEPSSLRPTWTNGRIGEA